MGKFAIYALVDPRDNSVFYVGLTDDVYKRFIQHIQCTSTNYAKNARMHELRAQNKMVIMETLEELDEREHAEERERYWIQHFEMMKEPIMNISKTTSPRKSKQINLRTGKRISIDIASAAVQAMQIAQLTTPLPVEAKIDAKRVYLLSEDEKRLVIELYKVHGNIDKVLRQLRKSNRYHADAARIVREAGV